MSAPTAGASGHSPVDQVPHRERLRRVGGRASEVPVHTKTLDGTSILNGRLRALAGVCLYRSMCLNGIKLGVAVLPYVRLTRRVL
jgi:hypothetical protein